MPNTDSRCLELFPEWLATLGSDVLAVSKLLRADGVRAEIKEQVAGALSYLLESMDLMPDGLDDLGFLDNAFVLREAASRAVSESAEAPDVLQRLAADAALMKEFLGDSDHQRLSRYVQGLRALEVRKRTAPKILASNELLNQFVEEVSAWVSAYEVPAFTKDDKSLVKLRSFMATKLPS